MDETTFIDLNAEPGAMPQLPPGTLNVPMLFGLALGALEVAGATPEAVLTSYSDVPSLWPIPPRLAQIGSMQFSVKVPDTGYSSGYLIDLHQSLRRTVRRCGLDLRVREMLADALGPKARHPLVFTPTEASAEAADLFSLEFILATGNSRSRLTIQANSVVRKFQGKREVLSNLKLNSKLSPKLTADWVASRTYGPRGVIVYKHFDAFDRCLVWADQNVPKEEAQNIRLALSWLKLCQDKELAYDFEQALHTITPFVADNPTDYGELLYSLESLDLARDLWLNQEDKDDHIAFRDFYGFLVPTYLDDDQFRKLFKTGMVLKEDFTDDIRKRIDAGMLNFSGWFLRMMRKYARE